MNIFKRKDKEINRLRLQNLLDKFFIVREEVEKWFDAVQRKNAIEKQIIDLFPNRKQKKVIIYKDKLITITGFKFGSLLKSISYQ